MEDGNIGKLEKIVYACIVTDDDLNRCIVFPEVFSCRRGKYYILFSCL